MGRFWKVNFVRTSQLDKDWYMVVVEGHEGVQFRIYTYVREGYGKDWTRRVSVGGKVCSVYGIQS